MLILKDKEFVEGIIGGIGWIISVLFIRKGFTNNVNTFLLSFISWALLWYIRKIGINLYNQYKKIHSIEDTNLSLNITYSKQNLIIISLVLICSLFGLIQLFKKPLLEVSKYGKSPKEELIIIFIMILFYLLFKFKFK